MFTLPFVVWYIITSIFIENDKAKWNYKESNTEAQAVV